MNYYCLMLMNNIRIQHKSVCDLVKWHCLIIHWKITLYMHIYTHTHAHTRSMSPISAWRRAQWRRVKRVSHHDAADSVCVQHEFETKMFIFSPPSSWFGKFKCMFEVEVLLVFGLLMSAWSFFPQISFLFTPKANFKIGTMHSNCVFNDLYSDISFFLLSQSCIEKSDYCSIQHAY